MCRNDGDIHDVIATVFVVVGDIVVIIIVTVFSSVQKMLTAC
jgi:hypothetical protein